MRLLFLPSSFWLCRDQKGIKIKWKKIEWTDECILWEPNPNVCNKQWASILSVVWSLISRLLRCACRAITVFGSSSIYSHGIYRWIWFFWIEYLSLLLKLCWWTRSIDAQNRCWCRMIVQHSRTSIEPRVVCILFFHFSLRSHEFLSKHLDHKN